jgi:hypothetical protein
VAFDAWAVALPLSAFGQEIGAATVTYDPDSEDPLQEQYTLAYWYIY